MKRFINKTIKWVAAAVTSFGIAFLNISTVGASGYGMTVSPMNETIVMDPGDTYHSSIILSNPSSSTEAVYYELEVEPFFVDEDHKTIYEAVNESGEIVNWIDFDVAREGKLDINEVREIKYSITVPKNAPAGGQYASIMVVTKSSEEVEKNGKVSNNSSRGINVKEVKRFSHLIYAEVTGSVVRKGEIINASLPSFLLSGNITGTATVKNNGNVHGDAVYKMQVFPLFSDEEVFTNEEDPATAMVFPNRSRYKELAWEGTPMVGIFNVVYTVEFEGATAQIKKMVIICPVWLLFIIIFAIALLILWILMRVRNGHGRKARSDDEE